MTDPVVTSFLAKLDSMHDFCGARNQHVTKDKIIHIIGFTEQEALHVKQVAGDKALVDALTTYGSGKYPSFEHATLELAKQVLTSGVLCEAEFTLPNKDDSAKFVEKLSSVRASEDTRSDYIVDTSKISFDTLCKHGDSKIIVTGATIFDKAGADVAPVCREFEEVEVSLAHDRGETMNYKNISITGQGPFTMTLDSTTISSDSITGQKFGVKTYSELMFALIEGKNNKARETKLNVLGLSIKRDSAQSVQRLMDYKRSGDWLQIESCKAILDRTGPSVPERAAKKIAGSRARRARSVNPTVNPIFLTIDRPAVARAILRQVPTLFSTNLDGRIVCTYYGSGLTDGIIKNIRLAWKETVAFNTKIGELKRSPNKTVLTALNTFMIGIENVISRFSGVMERYKRENQLPVEFLNREVLLNSAYSVAAFHLDLLMEMILRLMYTTLWLQKLYSGKLEPVSDLEDELAPDLDHSTLSKKNQFSRRIWLEWNITGVDMLQGFGDTDQLLADLELATLLLQEYVHSSPLKSAEYGTLRAKIKALPDKKLVLSNIIKGAFKSFEQLRECVPYTDRLNTASFKWSINMGDGVSGVKANNIMKERYELYESIKSNCATSIKYYTRLLAENHGKTDKIIDRIKRITLKVTGTSIMDRSKMQKVAKKDVKDTIEKVAGPSELIAAFEKIEASLKKGSKDLQKVRAVRKHIIEKIRKIKTTSGIKAYYNNYLNKHPDIKKLLGPITQMVAQYGGAEGLTVAPRTPIQALNMKMSQMQETGMIQILDRDEVVEQESPSITPNLFIARPQRRGRSRHEKTTDLIMDNLYGPSIMHGALYIPLLFSGASVNDFHHEENVDIVANIWQTLDVRTVTSENHRWICMVPVHTFDFSDDAGVFAISRMDKGYIVVDIFLYILFKALKGNISVMKAYWEAQTN